MEKLIEKYIDYLRYEKNYSSHTEISYSKDLSQFRLFVENINESVSVNDIDADLVRRWIVSLIEEGLSPRTVNRKLSSLKSFFAYLHRKGIVDRNRVHLVDGPKTPKAIPSFVSDASMDVLLEEASFDDSFVSQRSRAIMEIFYMTGIRRAELIELKDVDVDLMSKQIKVTGKRNKQRIIPIGDNLIQVLMDYISIRDNEVGFEPDSFFVRESGEPLYPMLVYRIVHDCLGQIATLSKTSPHVLRHSFATSMLNNGADINAIKELLGHSSLAATEVYTHTSFKELKEIYNKAHPRA